MHYSGSALEEGKGEEMGLMSAEGVVMNEGGWRAG